MLGDLWDDLHDVSPFLTGLLTVVAVLVVATVIERIFGRVVRRAYWRRVDRRAGEISDVGELSRLKRQKTLVTLLESLVRYGVYGVGVVVAISAVDSNATSTVFAGATFAVVVGFGLQRLLGDVVAGALLLFEGQFAVGDVITVHQHNVTGIVEEFSLRTTRLRTLGGDTVMVLNGGMVSLTRWSYGQRDIRVELEVRGETAAVRVRAAVAREGQLEGALWVTAPTVAADLEASLDADARRLVRIRTVVAPGHEVLVHRLAGVLAAEAGDDLVGEPLVLPLYEPVFEGWRAGVLLRG